MDKLTDIENRLTKLESKLNVKTNEGIEEIAADAVEKAITSIAPTVSKLGIDSTKKLLAELATLFKDDADCKSKLDVLEIIAKKLP